MTESSLSRRQTLRNIAALSAAGAAVALGATAVVSPAEAAQPNMDAALVSLNGSLAALQAATPDKGGYRARAINLVEQAIADVKAGIQWAKTHG